MCHLIEAGGSELNNAKEVASCIGVGSLRLVEKLLIFLKEKLTMEELSLLKSYGEGKMVPNKRDPFPEIYIFPDFEGASGELVKNVEGFFLMRLMVRKCTKLVLKF